MISTKKKCEKLTFDNINFFDKFMNIYDNYESFS